MDKQMTHKADGCDDPYRKHCFASIDVPIKAKAAPPLADAAFQCGLGASPVDEPARPQPRKLSGQENPGASPENPSARQPEKTAPPHPQDPDPAACLWEQFGGVLEQFEKERTRTFARAAAETLKLSMAISQKILNAPPGIDPDKTRSLVDEAWQNIEQEHIVHLKISPDDRKALEKTVPDAAGPNGIGAGYVFDEDPGLENGSCSVAGPRADMQNSLRNQLPLIERNFTACCLKKASYSKAADSAGVQIPYKGRP